MTVMVPQLAHGGGDGWNSGGDGWNSSDMTLAPGISGGSTTEVSQPPAPGKSSPRWAGPLSVMKPAYA